MLKEKWCYLETKVNRKEKSAAGEKKKGKMVHRTRGEKQADEGKEVVSLTHYKLIKWEYSSLPVRIWWCSAALSKTALFLQSIAP